MKKIEFITNPDHSHRQEAGKMETMKVQAQIRQNSEEISTYLTDLSKWEKTISARDQTLRGKKPEASDAQNRKANADDPLRSSDSATSVGSTVKFDKSFTPASIGTEQVLDVTVPVVPKSRNTLNLHGDMEELERERGNEYFRAGNFSDAVKSYTLCIGLKV
jgi:hypothetical protein